VSAPRVGTWYRGWRLLCRIIARTFMRLRTWGLENVPAEGGVILASNHQSYLDPMLVGCILKRQSRFLARSSLFGGPLGWLIGSTGAMPVERGEADHGALRRTVGLLEAGWLFTFFPEGTRTPDGGIKEAQPGVGFLAVRAGVPIVPVYIHGAFEMWPRSRKLPRPAPVGILYGEPIRPPRSDPSDRRGRKRGARAMARELQAAMEELERMAFELMPLRTRSAPPVVRSRQPATDNRQRTT